MVVTTIQSALSFDRPFELAVDASDVAVGAGLLQEDSDGIDHPLCYFSRKLDQSQRNYCMCSTTEKEIQCLALILSLHHFDIYVTACNSSLTVFSDHNSVVQYFSTRSRMKIKDKIKNNFCT